MPVKSHKASEYLNTQEDIVAYLNAAVEEMGDDPRLIMKALRNVAEARGGVSELRTRAPRSYRRCLHGVFPLPPIAGSHHPV